MTTATREGELKGSATARELRPQPAAHAPALLALFAAQCHHVMTAATEAEVMQRAAEAARELMGADIGCFAARAGDELRIGGHSGLNSTETPNAWRLPVGEGIGGRVVEANETIVVRDYRRDRRRSSSVSAVVDAEGIRSGVAVPVVVGQDVRGVLCCGSRTPRVFSADSIDAFASFGRFSGAVLGMLRSRDALRKRINRVEIEVEQLGLTTQLAGEFAKTLATNKPLVLALDILASHFDARVELRDRYGDPIGVAGRPESRLEIEVPVRAGNRLLGKLALLSAAPVSPFGRLSIEHVSSTLALRLLRDQAASETERRLCSRFLDGLLAGTQQDEERLRADAALLGLDLHNRAVACIGVRRTGARPGEVSFASGEVDSGTLSRLEEEAHGVARDPVFAFHDGFIVLLLDGSRQDDDALTGVVRTILAKSGRSDLAAGVGSTCTRLQDYAGSYREARFALDLACGHPGDQPVSTIEQLGTYGLFAHAADPELIRRRTQAMLAPLLGEDAQPLLVTLRSYFVHNRNLEKTASELFVHVNTVRHRLQRIEEILGIDLRNGEERFLLELAVRLQTAIGIIPPAA